VTTGSQIVLVTGGAGFIGSALSRRLANHYGRWVAFDSMHPQVHSSIGRPEALHEDAELLVGDVTRAEDWDRVLLNVTPDVIVHLAAETGTAQSLDEASRHAKVNVVGTAEMIDALGRHGQRPARVVLASSRAVYGEGEWRGENGVFSPGTRSHSQLTLGQWDFPGASPLPSAAATTPAKPTNVYGATKLAQENLIAAWCGAYAVEHTVLRLQNVYGPGQSLINVYTGIVSLFSQWAEEGLSIPVFEDGEIVRDFVYIDDVVSAFAAAIVGSVSGVFDIGSGDSVTLFEVATMIAAYHGSAQPRVTGEFREGDVRYSSCSIGRSVRALEWAPEWPIERGLAALQEWMAEQGLRASSSI